MALGVLEGTVEKVRERESVFDWKLKSFSRTPEYVNYECYSPEFHFGGRTWYLTLFPNGRKIKQTSEGYMGLYLGSPRPGPSNEFRFSVGIRKANGGTELEATHSDIIGGRDEWVCISDKMIERSELFRRREEFFPQDVLTIRATLREYLSGEGTKDVSVQTEVQDIMAYGSGEKTGTERVLQDIGEMWPDGDLCDVVIRVGGVEFRAHRAILAARAPVLAAMFRHDFAEKASGEVTIEDCEPAVFEQLLYYIYKGSLRELNAKSAFSLYFVADKYLVSEVKKLCVRCMRNTLCVDTFCDALTLSLVHREDELLRIATDFLSRNIVDVMQTVDWQMFLRDQPTWANEILLRAVKLNKSRYESNS